MTLDVVYNVHRCLRDKFSISILFNQWSLNFELNLNLEQDNYVRRICLIFYSFLSRNSLHRKIQGNPLLERDSYQSVIHTYAAINKLLFDEKHDY